MEKTNALNPLSVKKKVVVVGGGPAGMEAALISAQRGHDVTLYEAEDRLGGNLHNACKILFKHHIKELADWYANELKIANVNIQLNTFVTEEMLNDLKADVLFVSTGAEAKSFPIPGNDLPHVMFAHESYDHLSDLGEKVCIIGGGQIGMETAIWLAKEGKKVSVVEYTDILMGGAKNSPSGDIEMVELYIDFYHIDMYKNSSADKIIEDSVQIHSVLTNESTDIACDNVIIAVGYNSKNALYESIKNQVDIKEIYPVGDSKVVANIYNAIHEAYELANNI